HADAQDRSTAGEPTTDDPLPLDLAESLHAGLVRSHAGHQETVRVEGGLEVAGQGDVGTGPLQGAYAGAQVAGTVVEDDDRWLAAHLTPPTPSPTPSPSSVPLVDGTPVSRGSIAAASRKARAKALYCASTRWCGSRPARTRTCSAIWAWNEIDSKTWRVNDPW